MEGLLLQSREALDVEENLLCRGRVLTRSTDSFQHTVSMERVIFKGKARRKCHLQKTLLRQTLCPVQKTKEGPIL